MELRRQYLRVHFFAIGIGVCSSPAAFSSGRVKTMVSGLKSPHSYASFFQNSWSAQVGDSVRIPKYLKSISLSPGEEGDSPLIVEQLSSITRQKGPWYGHDLDSQRRDLVRGQFRLDILTFGNGYSMKRIRAEHGRVIFPPCPAKPYPSSESGTPFQTITFTSPEGILRWFAQLQGFRCLSLLKDLAPLPADAQASEIRERFAAGVQEAALLSTPRVRQALHKRASAPGYERGDVAKCGISYPRNGEQYSGREWTASFACGFDPDGPVGSQWQLSSPMNLSEAVVELLVGPTSTECLRTRGLLFSYGLKVVFGSEKFNSLVENQDDLDEISFMLDRNKFVYAVRVAHPKILLGDAVFFPTPCQECPDLQAGAGQNVIKVGTEHGEDVFVGQSFNYPVTAEHIKKSLLDGARYQYPQKSFEACSIEPRVIWTLNLPAIRKFLN